jgi:NADP-dependent 3-hydroxy acid dehydrogenase YdfG
MQVGYRSFVIAEDTEIDTIVDVNWLGVVKVCRAFIPEFGCKGVYKYNLHCGFS